MEYDIMLIKLLKRMKDSPDVQKVLSSFGCSIKVRLGLHETDKGCSEEGLLILQLSGDKEEMRKLENALNEMNHVKAQMITM